MSFSLKQILNRDSKWAKLRAPAIAKGKVALISADAEDLLETAANLRTLGYDVTTILATNTPSDKQGADYAVSNLVDAIVTLRLSKINPATIIADGDMKKIKKIECGHNILTLAQNDDKLQNTLRLARDKDMGHSKFKLEDGFYHSVTNTLAGKTPWVSIPRRRFIGAFDDRLPEDVAMTAAMHMPEKPPAPKKTSHTSRLQPAERGASSFAHSPRG